MKIILLLTIYLFLISKTSFGQSSNENVVFIVDSIAVVHDPEEGNELVQTDIADMTIIKNKDSLNILGYTDLSEFEKYKAKIRISRC